MATKALYGPWEAAEQLDSGHHWDDPVVTYSFPRDPERRVGRLQRFHYASSRMAKMVLGLWADVANITFKVSYSPMTLISGS